MKKVIGLAAVIVGLMAPPASAATQTLGPSPLEKPSLNAGVCLGDPCYAFNSNVSGAIVAAPQDGKIISWSMRSGELPLFQSFTATPTAFHDNGDGTWSTAGQGASQVVETNQVSTFTTDFPIKAGEIFGITIERGGFLPLVVDLDLSDSFVLSENFLVPPVNVLAFHTPLNATLETDGNEPPEPPEPPVITEKCRNQTATIVGTPGDDTITGTKGSDVIVSFGGNDVINGLGGDDVICAGGGDDQVRAHGGNDKVFGGAGDDSVKLGTGNDWARGMGGNDVLKGAGGADRLGGGTGADQLVGADNSDWLKGGRGDDDMVGGSGSDYLQGSHDNDSLSGGKGSDNLRGGDDDDEINGGAQKDRCKGGNGSDQMTACP